MKVAISAQSNDIDSLVDPRFGRAAGSSSPTRRPASGRRTTTRPNVGRERRSGRQAASTVAAIRASEAVITGNVGPNAHKVLAARQHRDLPGRERHHAPAERWKRWTRGELTAVEGPTVSGHWA